MQYWLYHKKPTQLYHSFVETPVQVHQRPKPEPTTSTYVQVSMMPHLYEHLLLTATSSNVSCHQEWQLTPEQRHNDSNFSSLDYSTEETGHGKVQYALQHQTWPCRLSYSLCSARLSRGNPQQLSQLKCKKYVYQNSFYPATFILWNRLP